MHSSYMITIVQNDVMNWIDYHMASDLECGGGSDLFLIKKVSLSDNWAFF